MYIIIGIIVLAIAAFALKKVHDKHHGDGGGCIRDCKNCAHPCHHKGRF